MYYKFYFVWEGPDGVVGGQECIYLRYIVAPSFLYSPGYCELYYTEGVLVICIEK